MILVLTYHRIVEVSALRSFFDVRVDELSRHVEQAGEIWRMNAGPGDLIEKQPGNDHSRGGFLITFDDGTTDHYSTAAPVLERHGVRGVFFVNTSRLGKEGYLTVSQCQELQARGHLIESHSHDHKQLTELTHEELHRQLKESRRVLRELGLGRCDFLAVPGGYFNSTVVEAAKTEHYALLRTLKWGYNRVARPMCVESIVINRKTAGRCFPLLIAQHFEGLKSAIYRTKEFVKIGRLGALYFAFRDRGPFIRQKRS